MCLIAVTFQLVCFCSFCFVLFCVFLFTVVSVATESGLEVLVCNKLFLKNFKQYLNV